VKLAAGITNDNTSGCIMFDWGSTTEVELERFKSYVKSMQNILY